MHWMILPFRRYFDFKGRSRRMEFWMFQLFNALVISALLGAFLLTFGRASFSLNGDMVANELDLAASLERTGVVSAVLALGALYLLVTVIPSTALIVRRLHDRDLSGWWYLAVIVAGLVPVAGALASIALFCVMALPGTPGPNRFGGDPKAPPVDADVFA